MEIREVNSLLLENPKVTDLLIMDSLANLTNPCNTNYGLIIENQKVSMAIKEKSYATYSLLLKM